MVPGHDRPDPRRIGALLRTAPKHPGDQAPNVLVILYDDLGFSHFNCFGSTLHTPNADRLAAGGVRFTNFHVTPALLPPPARRSSPAATTTPSACAAVANMQSGFPVADRPDQPPTRRRWPRCCATRATARGRSASGTWSTWRTRRRPDRSSTGRPSAASTGSTGSSRARPTSSIPSSPTTSTTSTRPARPTRGTTCPRT